MLKSVDAWMSASGECDDARVLRVCGAPIAHRVHIRCKVTEVAQSMFVGERPKVCFSYPKTNKRQRHLFHRKTWQPRKLSEKPTNIHLWQRFTRHIPLGPQRVIQPRHECLCDQPFTSHGSSSDLTAQRIKPSEGSAATLRRLSKSANAS